MDDDHIKIGDLDFGAPNRIEHRVAYGLDADVELVRSLTDGAWRAELSHPSFGHSVSSARAAIASLAEALETEAARLRAALEESERE